MRLNKRWMIAGAAVGLVSAIGIQAYGLMRRHVPPVQVFLFWPSGFIAGFYYPTAPIILPAILGNVLMFSAVAAVLGSRFLLCEPLRFAMRKSANAEEHFECFYVGTQPIPKFRGDGETRRVPGD